MNLFLFQINPTGNEEDEVEPINAEIEVSAPTRETASQTIITAAGCPNLVLRKGKSWPEKGKITEFIDFMVIFRTLHRMNSRAARMEILMRKCKDRVF